jgi:hypothetical protein
MPQQVLIRGKKGTKEIPVLVDDDGKIETTATLTGDITVGEVEVSNFPATQPVSGTVTIDDITGGDIDKVTVVDAVTDITNKVSIDTVDAVTTITNDVDVIQVDEYGWEAELTPQGEQRTIEPVRLAGTAFNGDIVDTNFWKVVTNTGGTITQGSGVITLSSGTTADNTVNLTSLRQGIFIPASTNRYRSQLIPTTGNAGCTRRWGAFDANNGFFFELAGTAFRIVIRKGGADTVIAQAAWSESTTFTLDGNIHTFEIYWTGRRVYFSIDDELKHIQTATTAALTATTTLPVRMECNNTGGSTTSRNLVATTAAIHRLGKLETAPMSKFISGAVTGQAKYNPGRLQRIIFTPGANGNTLILYDNTSATGELIKVGGSNTAGVTVSFEVGAQFYTGLYYAMTGTSSTATLIYE